MTDTTPQGSPFWRFSLAFYRLPKVADACIRLQEEAGVDVNVLLYLLWQAQQGRRLTADEVAALDAQVAPWREATVIPLRNVRRALKSPPALIAAVAGEAFRNRIKAVELEAERLQQEAMFALPARGHPGVRTVDAAQANVGAYSAALGVNFPQAPVTILSAAFASLPAAN
jgi:uncharacterized protein (TIGR02444 family)